MEGQVCHQYWQFNHAFSGCDAIFRANTAGKLSFKTKLYLYLANDEHVCALIIQSQIDFCCFRLDQPQQTQRCRRIRAKVALFSKYILAHLPEGRHLLSIHPSTIHRNPHFSQISGQLLLKLAHNDHPNGL